MNRHVISHVFPLLAAILPHALSAQVRVPPPAPTLTVNAVSVTVTGSSNQTTVSWNNLKEATGYQVMRRELLLDPSGKPMDKGTWLQLATVPGGPYGDVLPKPSVVYEYRVDAALPGLVAPSQAVMYTAPPFTTPANVVVSGRTTQATVSWTPGVGATGYVVSRLTVDQAGRQGKPSQLTPLPIRGTSFTDASLSYGTIYQYQVVSSDAAGVTYPSSWVAYSSPAPPPPKAIPPVVTIVGAGGHATLAWSATAGAVSYAVTRSQVDASGAVLVPPKPVTRGQVSALTLSDELPTPSAIYRYAVTALLADMTSIPANEVTFAAPAFTTPGGVTAAGAGGRVGLTWCAASGVAGYHVVRRTLNPDGTAGSTKQLTMSPLAAPGYIDQLSTPGLTYEYQVVGVGLDMRPWPSPWIRFADGKW